MEMGDIGLPDIQRPFVWPATKVRDLLDSMYRGFPIGYLLFWKNANVNGMKQIGTKEKGHKVPALLIVDGQQRLTSLYAVFQGQPIIGENYQSSKIEIAFRPRDGKFEVSDAAIKKDAEFISDISLIWTSGKSSRKLVNDFIDKLEEAKGELSHDDQEIIGHNLDRLFDLKNFPFTALEIVPTVSEEEVADIFVRINSQGVKLNQADFILTLLSVFWEEGRKELESFCRHSYEPPKSNTPSPFNYFIKPSPDQLLRVSIAFGFLRGRLKSVYQILRGKDVETDTYSPEKRDEQFTILKEAQAEVLNLTNWHQFLSCLAGAGFRSSGMISSEMALLYSYAFYLIGRVQLKVPEHVLSKLIGRWFFVSQLSGRYTGSPETIMDSDLNRLKGLTTPEEFVATLEQIMKSSLTDDYWTVTLPNELASSASRSPVLFAYYAAVSLLDAPALFSHKKVRDLLDPAIQSKKRMLERHHLFPRAWLERSGVMDMKLINQLANFAPLEWPDNIEISDECPSDYMKMMRDRIKPDVLAAQEKAHGLPEGWDTMPYEEFLTERQKRMADIIRHGYEVLT
ncbi:MAG: DUF262 domain-containing protein [Alphaproteobacteria bacterium]|nr:DUF262 domain-containing protein [Alphaproteobacteria bacterium]